MMTDTTPTPPTLMIFVGCIGPGPEVRGECCMSCLRAATNEDNEPVGIVLEDGGPWDTCPLCGRRFDDPAHADAIQWAREIMDAQMDADEAAEEEVTR